MLLVLHVLLSLLMVLAGPSPRPSPCLFPAAADPDCCIRKLRPGFSVHRLPKLASASTAPTSERRVCSCSWHQLCPPAPVSSFSPFHQPFPSTSLTRNSPLGPPGPPASSLKDRFSQGRFLLCSLSVFSNFRYSLKNYILCFYIY